MIKNKKIIAGFLAFIILFTNIPFQAIATGITTESKTESRSISESAISGRTEPMPPVNQGAQMETLQNPVIESVTEELQPPMQDTPAEMDEAVISDIENLIKNGPELHAQYSSILQYNDETASARATLSYENSKTTYLDTSYQVPLTYSEVKENSESIENILFLTYSDETKPIENGLLKVNLSTDESLLVDPELNEIILVLQKGTRLEKQAYSPESLKEMTDLLKQMNLLQEELSQILQEGSPTSRENLTQKKEDLENVQEKLKSIKPSWTLESTGYIIDPSYAEQEAELAKLRQEDPEKYPSKYKDQYYTIKLIKDPKKTGKIENDFSLVLSFVKDMVLYYGDLLGVESKVLVSEKKEDGELIDVLKETNAVLSSQRITDESGVLEKAIEEDRLRLKEMKQLETDQEEKQSETTVLAEQTKPIQEAQIKEELEIENPTIAVETKGAATERITKNTTEKTELITENSLDKGLQSSQDETEVSNTQKVDLTERLDPPMEKDFYSSMLTVPVKTSLDGEKPTGTINFSLMPSEGEKNQNTAESTIETTLQKEDKVQNNADGTYTQLSNGGIYDWRTNTLPIQIENKELPKLKINKVDENNAALKGATFRITSDTGYNKTISGENLSEFEFIGLIPGNYRIEEIVVPDGFTTPPTYWVFKVEQDDAGVYTITSPDFPMSVETDNTTEMKGDYAENYISHFSNLVRNEDPYIKEILNASGSKIGTISKRIIGHEGDNAYKMEVILKADTGQTITSGKLTDYMGDHFNVSLGEDSRFTRDDYSLTASDGSFYYIEHDGTKYIEGVYGGEPFSTNRILDGSNLDFIAQTDLISITGLKVTNGEWIKLVYNFEFDETKTNEKDTFYWTNGTATFSGLSNNTTTKTTNLARPAARPIVNNVLNETELTVINTRDKAQLSVKKIGSEEVQNTDGTTTEQNVNLQGAVFELYKNSTNDSTTAEPTGIKQFSNYDGIVTVTNLQRDYQFDAENYSETYYWLKEIGAPDGYAEIEDLIGPFRINYDGTIEYLGTLEGQNTVSHDGTYYTVKNEKNIAVGTLRIHKMVNDATGTPLSNTTFTLYSTDGVKPDLTNPEDPFWTTTKEVMTGTTDPNGFLELKDISEGYYRLQETKPHDGYIQSDNIYYVAVDEKGVVSLVLVEKPVPSPANFMQSQSSLSIANAVMSSALSLASAPISTMAIASLNIPSIPTTELAGLYPTGIDPRKDNAATTAPFTYTNELTNNTGFAEKYVNPDYVTGLYQYDGMYDGQKLEDVAGVNKYIVPTGVPGEYEVHVKISGNRVTSTTGVILVYDNSNSMEKNDRLTKANEAISTFLNNLLDPNDPSTNAALVTYGSTLLPTYSHESFTNDPAAIISKLPTTIPTDRGRPNDGGTYTEGAIARAKDLLEASGYDNQIIVTITDGVPTFSNLIKEIDAEGNYISSGTKTGIGNRFIDPFTHDYYGNLINTAGGTAYFDSYYVEDKTKPYDPNAAYAKESTATKYYYNLKENKITNSNHQATRQVDRGYYPFTYVYPSYGGYARVTYRPTGTSYYYNGYYYYPSTYGYYRRGNWIPNIVTETYTSNALPNNGYGYKLISNHGYATIDTARDIQDTGTQMYTIGIQIDASTYAYGSSYPDASRPEALEVMFGLSSSKDTYFDTQNISDLPSYLEKIRQELAELNAPTVNNGSLIDPMGDMVTLQQDSVKLRDSGAMPIVAEVGGAITRTIDETGIRLDHLNLSYGQEIEMTYKVNLKTEDPNYQPDTLYPTNGRTTLQPNSESETLWDLPIPKISGPVVGIDVSKEWQNPDGTADTDPKDPIQIKLQKRLVGQGDDSYVDDPNREIQTIGQDQDWTYAFENLPPFDNQGNVYEYRIVEISSDGSYSILYEGNGANRAIINRQILNYDVRNIANQIDFTKIDGKYGNPLEGVEFLLRKDGSLYVDPADPTKSYAAIKSDAQGKIYFEKLVPGVYELIESRIDGYEVPQNPVKTFIVDKDGKIKQSNDAGDLVEITENDIFKTIENTPIEVDVKFTKVDGSNSSQVLPGAEFKLYYADQKTEVNPGTIYTSDTNGVVSLGVLRVGLYYLEEITPPEGYEPIPHMISLIVQNDGRTNLGGVVKGPEETQYVENYKEKTTEIAVKKLARNDQGEVDAISGATFDISKAQVDAEGNVVDPIQFEPVPNPGKAVNYQGDPEKPDRYGMFTGLTEGIYRIDERWSPLGYLRYGGYFTFEVVASIDPDTGEKINTVTWIKKHANAEDTTGAYIYQNGVITNPDGDLEDAIKVIGSDKITTIMGLQLVNDPNKLSFQKVDGADPSILLQDVRFELFYEVNEYEETIGRNEDGTTVKLRAVKEGVLLNAADPQDTTPVVRTTDGNGLISFTGLPQRIVGQDKVVYYLKETNPDPNYQTRTTLVGPYTVTENGILGPDGRVINSIENLNPDPVQVKNFLKPDLQITKIDGRYKDTRLEGAGFELRKAAVNDDGTYKPAADAVKVGEMKLTNENGTLLFEAIEEGLYWVYEVKTPGDYMKLQEPLGPFLVKEGKIYTVELDETGKIKETPVVEVGKDTTGVVPIYNETVENIKGTYPSTGGIGSRYFYLIGLSLMLAAFIKKKMDEKKRKAAN